MNNKVNDAIKSGELVTFQDVLKSLPEDELKLVHEKARYIKIANSIKNLRKKLNLTQEELAKKLNNKREYISRIESGRQNITLETLYHIAEATNKEIIFEFK